MRLPVWLSTYARLWRLLLRRRRTLAVALVAMAGAAAATGVFAALTGPALKLLFTGGELPGWLAAGGAIGRFLRAQPAARLRLWLPLSLLLVSAVRAGFGGLQANRMASLCLRTVADLQEALHRRLLRLPLSYFEGRHSGEVYARFTSDLGHVDRALSQGLTYSLRDVFQLVALVWVSIALDWRLFALACVTLPVGVYAIARFARALRRVSVAYQAQQARLIARAQDLLAGATVLQMYRAEPAALRAQAAAEADLLALGRHSAALRGAVTPTVELLAYVGLALVLSALQGPRLDLPPEKVVSFVGAVLLCYQPLKSIASNSQWIVPGLTAAERLFQLLDEAPAIADAPRARPLVLEGAGGAAIAFEAATVRYGERAVLSEVSLSLRPGERVAIVGRSGAGKSTLLHLVPRLLDVSAGQVRVGGAPVRELTLTSLRAEIALVGQEVFLFDASVADNLRVGRGALAPPAALEAALDAAGALAFVRQLPAGLETRLGERGLTLSGGQRQRLSIARALLKGARVLLLDEAMSALDPPLEAEVLRRLLTAAGQATIVMVTHRLASAALLDRVLVIEDGRVVEDGPPAALLASGAWFALAHRAQSVGSASPAGPA